MNSIKLKQFELNLIDFNSTQLNSNTWFQLNSIEFKWVPVPDLRQSNSIELKKCELNWIQLPSALPICFATTLECHVGEHLTNYCMGVMQQCSELFVCFWELRSLFYFVDMFTHLRAFAPAVCVSSPCSILLQCLPTFMFRSSDVFELSMFTK